MRPLPLYLHIINMCQRGTTKRYDTFSYPRTKSLILKDFVIIHDMLQNMTFK